MLLERLWFGFTIVSLALIILFLLAVIEFLASLLVATFLTKAFFRDKDIFDRKVLITSFGLGNVLIGIFVILCYILGGLLQWM